MPAVGDHVAIIGENRKLLVFPLDASAGNVARQGRAPAEIQGWRHLRRARLRVGGRPDLEGFGGPDLTVVKPELTEWIGARADGGPPAAEGLSEDNRFR